MVLNGWKEIAKHLGCGVRTAQRWEQLGIGLPIHRPKLGTGIVCAFVEDIDEWLRNTPRRVLAVENEQKPQELSSAFRYQVLVVDDDVAIRSTQSAILAGAGFDVRAASDGFHALALMREGGVPDLLVSDLKMPNMSGFELLAVVRKRFPAISVIAISGDFTPTSPAHPLADHFLPKGENMAERLIQAARDLLERSPVRTQLAKAKQAPAWIPKLQDGYVVITCTECLRSFSVPVSELAGRADAEIVRACVHCDVPVRFQIDSAAFPELSRGQH